MSDAEIVRLVIALLTVILLFTVIVRIVKVVRRKFRSLISKLSLCFHLTVNTAANPEPHVAPNSAKRLLRCAYCGTLNRLFAEKSMRCEHCGAPLDPDQ